MYYTHPQVVQPRLIQTRTAKMMELLRPAVLGSSDSLGVHWLGAWSYSVRPGSRASHVWRAHAYC